MKEETIKTIANVTGFVAGLAAELVVNTALCAVIPSGTVRTFARKLVATIGVSTTAWVVGCKVSDYVCDAVIGLAEEVEDIKNTVKAKISEAADEVEESEEIDDIIDEPTAEETDDTDDEDCIYIATGDKATANKYLKRFVGHLNGFIKYNIRTGKVSHMSNFKSINDGEMCWPASLLNDFAHVIRHMNTWVIKLPRPLDYEQQKGGAQTNV